MINHYDTQVEVDVFFSELATAHRELHVLTHSFPTRRSFDLPFYNVLFRFSGRRRRGSYFNFLVTALFLTMVQAAVAVPLALAGFVMAAHVVIWIFATCCGIVNEIGRAHV